MGGKKNGIPDRWLPYKTVGKQISGTKFMAFKVPLKEMLGNRLAPTERFSPTQLIEMEPKLSLIIDLTNTNRYYDKQEFLSKGIDYAKIYCPGHVIPPPYIVQTFFDIVDKFTSISKKKDGLIGVHCTHGVNRTGYLLCRYMIQKLGMEPKDAIGNFQEARGHEIERENYIQSLNGCKTLGPNERILKENTADGIYESASKQNREPSRKRTRNSRFSDRNDIPCFGDMFPHGPPIMEDGPPNPYNGPPNGNQFQPQNRPPRHKHRRGSNHAHGPDPNCPPSFVQNPFGPPIYPNPEGPKCGPSFPPNNFGPPDFNFVSNRPKIFADRNRNYSKRRPTNTPNRHIETTESSVPNSHHDSQRSQLNYYDEERPSKYSRYSRGPGGNYRGGNNAQRGRGAGRHNIKSKSNDSEQSWSKIANQMPSSGNLEKN